MVWQSPALALTRTGLLEAAVWSWRAQPILQTYGVVVIPSQMVWVAAGPLLTRGMDVTGGRKAWRAQPVTLGRGLVVGAAQMQWASQALLLPRRAQVVPVTLRWRTGETTAIGPPLLVQVVPGTMQWQAQGVQTATGLLPGLNPIGPPVYLQVESCAPLVVIRVLG